MWFMNHIWNPIVRFIMRSPLHGLMSKDLMLITYQGQKSGKEYTLLVSYLEDGATVFVIPGMPDKKVWWHNIQENTPVQILLRGKSISARASLLSAEKDMDVMARTLGLFCQKMPAGESMYKVHKDAAGKFNNDDLKQAVRNIVMVSIQPE
jgi:deazaflavin-dependent oxidoreductase (nitroreductase family)